jgi:hypothetical protein
MYDRRHKIDRCTYTCIYTHLSLYRHSPNDCLQEIRDDGEEGELRDVDVEGLVVICWGYVCVCMCVCVCVLCE